jgi:hypothetical protein
VGRRDMSSVRAALIFSMSPIRKGRVWRVQIKQPDGSVRCFGRFTSEKRAREWIAVHYPRGNTKPEATDQRIVREKCVVLSGGDVSLW